MSDMELPDDWWERRAAMTLRVYRVANWAGRSLVAMTGESHRMTVMNQDFAQRVQSSEGSESFVNSTTVVHRRDPEENDEFVDVTSSLSDGEHDGTWCHAVANMLIAVVRDERDEKWPDDASERHRQVAIDEQRREELRESIDTGRIPWRRIIIFVDGAPVEFDAVSIGEYSAAIAVGDVDGIDIDIWSRQVELSGLQLVHRPGATTAFPVVEPDDEA